ncbi:hypothetical protein AB0F43_20820 [Kribbella sp. NPDC023972]|uniref:hypothetical protein n=1 Tax=Kribbella sp. NPDC023972 TaxID=3154795 RepID=UPI0033EB5F78
MVSITFGVRSGIAAGLLAVVLIVVWTILRDVSLTPTGWAARVLPILLLGLVLGDASDRLSRAETERRQLEAEALLRREAIEINDSLVQGMAAARWSFEAGRMDAGMRTLDETIIQGQDLVSDLIRRAGMADRTEQVGGAARSGPTTPPSDHAPRLRPH